MASSSLAFRASRLMLNLEQRGGLLQPAVLAAVWGARASQEHARCLAGLRDASLSAVWVYASVAGHFGRLALEPASPSLSAVACGNLTKIR